MKGASSFLTPDQQTTKIWEPNSDVHTTAAIAAAKSYYNMNDVQATDDDPIPYYGIKQAITSPVLLKDTNGTDQTNFSQITPTFSTDKVMSDVQNAFSLETGITKMRIYMWVEGQDIDCENNASGSNITFTLEFEVPEVGGAG